MPLASTELSVFMAGWSSRNKYSLLGAMRAIAKLKPSIPVTAFVPAVENMINGRAQRPGDIVKTLDGKTVYLVDCRFDDSDILLKSVQAWFTEHMPGVKTVYKPISSVYTKDDPQTWQEIQSTGHAAIVGVGH